MESTAALEGSCFQNILKTKRLEHQSYRQKRNFDRERLSGEMHNGVWKPGAPQALEWLLPNLKNSS
jgi:hypothetical protein